MGTRVAARALLIVLLAGAGVASAWAATVRGTPHADVLSGTKHADVIYGRAGNDKLYGLAGNDKLYGGPGNDLLVGGPGADLLDCGPGKDTAVADRSDTLNHCETVIRVGAPKPPPPPTTTSVTTTAPTTTTAPGPGPNAEPGHYCGFTNNGDAICFDITGNQQFTNAAFTVTFRGSECNPPATGTANFTTGGAAPLKSDNSFDFAVASGDEKGTEVSGTVTSTGTASGTLTLRAVIASGGTTYTCGLDTSWTATRQ